MAMRNAKLKTAVIAATDTGPGPAVPESVDTLVSVIDHDEIARLAYSYWQARGFCGGSAEEDWYRAEEELKKRTARPDQR